MILQWFSKNPHPRQGSDKQYRAVNCRMNQPVRDVGIRLSWRWQAVLFVALCLCKRFVLYTSKDARRRPSKCIVIGSGIYILNDDFQDL